MLAGLSGALLVDVEFFEEVVDHPLHPISPVDFVLLSDLVKVRGGHTLADKLLQDDLIHLFALRRHRLDEFVEEVSLRGAQQHKGDEQKGFESGYHGLD